MAKKREKGGLSMEILRPEELSCGEDFRNTAQRILRAGEKFSCLVPAPGPRFPGDVGVEELLRWCISFRRGQGPWRRCFAAAAERFREIAAHSGSFFPVERELSALEEKLRRGEDVVPYGAKLSALILKDLISRPKA